MLVFWAFHFQTFFIHSIEAYLNSTSKPLTHQSWFHTASHNTKLINNGYFLDYKPLGKESTAATPNLKKGGISLLCRSLNLFTRSAGAGDLGQEVSSQGELQRLQSASSIHPGHPGRWCGHQHSARGTAWVQLHCLWPLKIFPSLPIYCSCCSLIYLWIHTGMWKTWL